MRHWGQFYAMDIEVKSRLDYRHLTKLVGQMWYILQSVLLWEELFNGLKDAEILIKCALLKKIEDTIFKKIKWQLLLENEMSKVNIYLNLPGCFKHRIQKAIPKGLSY